MALQKGGGRRPDPLHQNPFEEKIGHHDKPVVFCRIELFEEGPKPGLGHPDKGISELRSTAPLPQPPSLIVQGGIGRRIKTSPPHDDDKIPDRRVGRGKNRKNSIDRRRIRSDRPLPDDQKIRPLAGGLLHELPDILLRVSRIEEQKRKEEKGRETFGKLVDHTGDRGVGMLEKGFPNDKSRRETGNKLPKGLPKMSIALLHGAPVANNDNGNGGGFGGQGTFHAPIIRREAEKFNEVECGARSPTSSPVSWTSSSSSLRNSPPRIRPLEEGPGERATIA